MKIIVNGKLARVLSVIMALSLIVSTSICVAVAVSENTFYLDFESSKEFSTHSSGFGTVDYAQGQEALNGMGSVKITGSKTDATNGYGEASAAQKEFAVISSYSYDSILKQGFMMRIKIDEGESKAASTAGKTHEVKLVFLNKASGGKQVYLGSNINGAVKAYNINGEEVAIYSGSSGTLQIPAGFDGFLFISLVDLKHAESGVTFKPADYKSDSASYKSTYDTRFVDFSSYNKFRPSVTNVDNDGAVYIDDIMFYETASDYTDVTVDEHISIINSLGYEINIEEEETTFLMDFESGTIFSTNSPYGSISLATGTDALNGNSSLKISGSKTNDNGYGVASTNTPAEAIPGDTSFDFSKISEQGFMVRAKFNEKESDTIVHQLQLIFKNSNNANVTVGNGGKKTAKAYDLKGNEVNLYAGSGNAMQIPAGFDGYLFISLLDMYSADKNESGTTLGTVKTDGSLSLEDYNKYYVDFTKEVKFRVNINNADNSGSVIIDDIAFYTGTTAEEHLAFIENLGYTFIVEQEEVFSFRLNFEESAIFSTSSGYGTVSHATGNEALNGNGSFKITGSQTKDNGYGSASTLTLSNAIPGVSDFSYDKLQEQGFMMRVKFNEEENADITHQVQLLFRRVVNSANKTITVGAGKRRVVKAYDLEGNDVDLYADSDTTMQIPAGFDGYLFIPLLDMYGDINNKTFDPSTMSEDDYRANYIDFTEDLKFRLNITNAANDGSVVIDDITFYSGNTKRDNLSLIKRLGYELDFEASVGDINGDLLVNEDDVIALRKHLLGINVLINTNICDVNKDEDVNICDLVRLVVAYVDVE